MAELTKPREELLRKFNDLVAKDIDSHAEYFLKSFIFALGDDWKEIGRLATAFKDYLVQLNENGKDLNCMQAADFLQKKGKTRTAVQRREELKDIDLDKNDRIAFIEYLLLHYKKTILEEYYKRVPEAPKVDLGQDAIGVTGTGLALLDELFTLPLGMDPALERAIEQFTEQKRARENKMQDLNEKAKAGGVKGRTAGNELAQMKSQDSTEMNRMELTLEAAKRKASRESGSEALRKKKEKEEKEKAEAAAASKNRLKNMAAMWENK